jgi:hypothetical protein
MWQWLSDLEATLDLTEMDFVSARLHRLEARVAALESECRPSPTQVETKIGWEHT